MNTTDLPTDANVTTSTFADDTTLVANDADPVKATEHLKNNLNSIRMWLKQWRIKVNEHKSGHVTFTLKGGVCLSVSAKL